MNYSFVVLTAMEAKRSGLKAIIDEEYMKMNIGETTAFSVSEPNLSVARRNVEEVHSQIKRRAKDCKKLENEWKILEFHKQVNFDIWCQNYSYN